MIKTITFDFGGVLYSYDEEHLLETLAAGSGVGVEELRKLLDGSRLDRAHFRGEVKADHLVEILEREIGLKISRNELAEAYAGAVEPNEEMFELVRELAEDYNIQLYSDTPEILYRRVIKKMPIIDLFSAVTLSFEIGALKDSTEGYLDLIEKSSHSPDEIVFIDDRKEYVEKASEAGINGIQFTEFLKLLNELEGLGVRLDGRFEL